MASSSFKFVVSSMLTILAILYIVTMIAEQRKFSFALATFFALIIMLVVVNIDGLQELSNSHTGTMLCAWTIFFIIQVCAIAYVFLTEDMNKEGYMHRIWIELDGVVAVMTLAVVLHHLNMLCGGAKKRSGDDAAPQRPNEGEYVAIPVQSRRKIGGKSRRLKNLAF